MSEESQFDSRRRLRFCLISKAFRLPLWPTQPPIQGVLVAFSGRQCGLGVKLTTRLHLVPRLSGAIISTFSHAITACIRINVRGQIQRLYHCFRSTNWNYLVAWRWISKNHSRKVLWVNEIWRCQIVGSDCGIAESFRSSGILTSLVV